MRGAELSPKVKILYRAVIELFEEGTDLNTITVAEITGKAGIGKGTAYEYFSNKEEMIAGAIFEELKTSCRLLYDQLEQAESVKEKADILLKSMEQRLLQTNCFFRALHVLMDNSAIGQKLKELFQSKDEDDILVMELVQKFVTDEAALCEGMGESENSYLSMMLFSKLICYGMYLYDRQELNSLGKIDNSVMREMLCRGICEDFERNRGKA